LQVGLLKAFAAIQQQAAGRAVGVDLHAFQGVEFLRLGVAGQPWKPAGQEHEHRYPFALFHGDAPFCFY